MDFENLPTLRSLLIMLILPPKLAMSEGASRSSEYSDKLAAPSLQVAMLQDMQKDIFPLTCIVTQFLEYNINREEFRFFF